jgi:precorrin-6B methylase 2
MANRRKSRITLGDRNWATFVLEVAHREVEGLAPVAAGDVGEPLAVFVGGGFADAADVLPHGKPQA